MYTTLVLCKEPFQNFANLSSFPFNHWPKTQWITRGADLLFDILSPKLHENKKVLLRERKRHTTRRVASVGEYLHSPNGRYPHPVLTGQGTPSNPNWGTPIQSSWGVSHQSLWGIPLGTPISQMGYPHWEG